MVSQKHPRFIARPQFQTCCHRVEWSEFLANMQMQYLFLLVAILLLSQSQEMTGLTISNLDTNTIYTGLFDGNNIFIHVFQNFFNFLVSTFGWVFVAILTNSPNTNGRSLDTVGPLEQVAQLFKSTAEYSDRIYR